VGRTPPVFIGGCGRSGTTLLVDVLGSHGELSPVYETAAVLRIANIMFGRGAGLPLAEKRRRVVERMAVWSRDLPFQPHIKKDYERYLHGPHYVLFDRAFAMREAELLAQRIGNDDVGAFRRFVFALCDEHARRDGKPRWINKVPLYVLMLPILSRAFPEMRFLHSVRDPRDVIPSLLNSHRGLSGIDQAAGHWLECARAGAEFATRCPGACFEVRYEDLIAEPLSVLARAFAWLGVEDRSAEVCASYGGAFDRGRAENWRARGDRGEIERIEKIALPMMARFGYQPIG